MRKAVRALVRMLRKEAPPLLPVRVYERERLPDDAHGTCELKYDAAGRPLRFVINLRKMPDYTAQLVLLHEWGHCLAWQQHTHDTVDDHGPEWALAYARIYQLTFSD